MNKQAITVLKFGSSVLIEPNDFHAAAREIRRFLEHGQRVVAVVSALDGRTDRLLQAGRSVANGTESSGLAELVATGEQESALLLALALENIDVVANVTSAEEIKLAATGSRLNADLVAVDRTALLKKTELHAVAIVSGFVGIGGDGYKKLLGRGGSDLTAIFIAQQLGARCRLVKDVDGIFDCDPAVHGTRARKFVEISWNDTLNVAGELVQSKATRYANKHGFCFEVACLASDDGTLVGPTTTAPFGHEPVATGRILLQCQSIRGNSKSVNYVSGRNKM